MSVHDVLSAEPGGGPVDEGVVAAARRVAGEVLTPAAEATDQAPLVPRSNLRALADASLFALARPGTTPATVRAVHEALAGACGATYFCWVQHHSPTRLVAAARPAVRERWLADLLSGRVQAAVAFAYLRRPGPPAVVALPAGPGWRLDGRAPWVTAWGLADVVLVAAVRPDGTIAHHLLPATAGHGLKASTPLALSAMNATGSVALTFDGLRVADDQVVEVSHRQEWDARDRVQTAQPSPAAFGLAAASIAALPPDAAEPLALEWAELRLRSYEAADACGPEPDDEGLDRLVDLRTATLALAVRCAQAEVVMGGGRSYLRSAPAQRRYREAGFYLVQAQTRAIREATIRRLTTRG
jgi:alkylation response protein AidB-like acyl-CoA dehydrogenase